MKTQKMYEQSDKLINIIRDNYNILQSLGSFGLSLGFGDKTVQEVCEEQHVDTYTFLAVVNFTINGYIERDHVDRLSLPTLLHYLKASHQYYLGFLLPAIRNGLTEALDTNDRLLEGSPIGTYNFDTFSKHHQQIDSKLRELKNIIIKYLPADSHRSNQLGATLYNIYNCETWLGQHAKVEDQIFAPAVRYIEEKTRKKNVSQKISSMINKAGEQQEKLSDREKEVIVSLVQGMTNKEIADHLFISVNTVITHRRNIAHKLQIHSPAGLTIYAIVNNLVDISSVKL